MAYFPGHHGAAIVSKDNIRSISRFIVEGWKDTVELIDRSSPLTIASNLTVVWVSAVACLVLALLFSIAYSNIPYKLWLDCALGLSIWVVLELW